MTVAADQVLTDEVFRVYAARLYPVALRVTGNARRCRGPRACIAGSRAL